MTDWTVQSVIFCTCLIQSAKVGHFCVSLLAFGDYLHTFTINYN